MRKPPKRVGRPASVPNQIPTDTPEMYKKSVAIDAYNAIHGVKRAAYGPVEDSFQKAAIIASIGTSKDISPTDIAMIMIAVKYVRESAKHDRDNMLDICGYADLNQQLWDLGLGDLTK